MKRIGYKGQRMRKNEKDDTTATSSSKLSQGMQCSHCTMGHTNDKCWVLHLCNICIEKSL